MKVTIYQVESFGQVIFKGTYREVEEFLNAPTGIVCNYTDKPMCYKKKYYIKKCGMQERVLKYQKRHRRRKSDKEEEPVEHIVTDDEYLLTQLRLYNNTTFGKDPKPFVGMLKENGFNVSYHPSRFKKNHYIIEVI